jgi:DNA polymerase elongation subunit (family B)
MAIKDGPKVLTLDIETSELLLRGWGLYDQNFGPSDIEKDWELYSVAWKWTDRAEVFQLDRSGYSEKFIVKAIQKVVGMADIIVTQNGKKFDVGKINAKLQEYNLKLLKRTQHFDTRIEAKKLYVLPSYSLEYMSNKFNKKYKKLKHNKFPGKELWRECEKGNKSAWKEMAKYNKWDVLATEELFLKMRSFSNTINWSVYYGVGQEVCGCGSTQFIKNGYSYRANGKSQRYTCKKCGAEFRHKTNLHKGKFRKV